MHTPADDWESFFHVLSWVVLRFTRHGLTQAKLTNDLRDNYDRSYMDTGEIQGGQNKKEKIISRYMSTDAKIPPGPLLDLLKDLVDVCAVRYEDPPPGEAQERYELLLQLVDPSFASVLVDNPVKLYNDRKKKLDASWMLERFRDAANSGAWDLGPEGQRFVNPLVLVNEEPVTKKRQSEYETDVPRQPKRFKVSLNGGDNETVEEVPEADKDDVEEEDGDWAENEDEEVDELAANEDEEEGELALMKELGAADTDWDDDESETVDETELAPE